MHTKITKQAKKLQSARSNFERWLIKNGLRQSDAAELLGIGLRQIHDYASGVSQHTQKPVSPPKAMRILMRIVDENQRIPDAWPE